MSAVAVQPVFEMYLNRGSDLDWAIDYTDELEDDDFIVTSVWESSSVDITLHDDAIWGLGKKTQVFVDTVAGDVGDKIIVTNTYTTDSTPPRTDKRRIIFTLVDR